jgi:hypothetical protein
LIFLGGPWKWKFQRQKCSPPKADPASHLKLPTLNRDSLDAYGGGLRCSANCLARMDPTVDLWANLLPATTFPDKHTRPSFEIVRDRGFEPLTPTVSR